MTCQSASRRGLHSPALFARTALPLSLARSIRIAPIAPVAPIALIALIALIAPIAGAPAAAQSLYGSHESLVRQNLVAQQHDYAYLRTPQEVAQAVEGGVLVAVHANEDLQLADGEVSFRYARPQVKTFLEQLASAYHAACGEPLVITSLVRPISRQPWNASPISVHPTGMAVDMRRSDRRGCRQWLESTLLALEGEGMIEAIRERWPPHYHVAVFPDPLLLPGPIGDPNGVVRVAALATLHGGPLAEPETFSDGEPVARHARVHLGRSARTGRFRITQTAVARRGQRTRTASAASAASATNPGIDIHRSSRRGARHGQQARDGRNPQAAGANHSGTVANARLAAKHRSATHSHPRARSRAASRTTTVAAR